MVLFAMLSVSGRAFAFRAPSVARQASRLHAVATKGDLGTMDFRLFFKDGDKTISPWHDVPLEAGDGFYNFVCEIPKYTKAKMEVATKEESNPIAQDTKKGKLRDYHGPIFWNYGCLPQTWEDPGVEHPELKVNGDDDPLDVVEIGSGALEMGSITPVKPIGMLAMIDDGELDWKLIAIRKDDPLAAEINSVEDLEAKMPHQVDGIREWFRWYKTPDDKPLNAFGFDEKCLSTEESIEVIKETHAHWKALREGTTDAGKLWTGN